MRWSTQPRADPLLRDIAISAVLVLAGFLLGIGYMQWRGHPTRQALTDDLAERIAGANPGLSVETSYVSTSGPMIYLTMPPVTPGELARPVARVEIGHDGEILPSFHDFDDDFIAYHWNKSMTEEETLARIDQIEAEYGRRQ